MKIGVFDSGIGGEAIALSLKKDLSDITLITVDDKKNLPYGNKTQIEIINLTDKAIQPLINAHCDIIVIACNTATALAIDFLRSKYPEQNFIGIEPMIKTASGITKTKNIAVCATPATLKSNRYKNLVLQYAKDSTLIEPDCSQWAKMIEDNDINHHLIAKTIEQIRQSNADVIVLGCTHYHWIKDLIIDLAGKNIKVIEPSEAISRRVKHLLNKR